jgi:hypothetical protein
MRPRGSWIHAMDRDAKIMLKCKNWKRATVDRDAWRQRIAEPKTQVGL